MCNEEKIAKFDKIADMLLVYYQAIAYEEKYGSEWGKKCAGQSAFEQILKIFTGEEN